MIIPFSHKKKVSQLLFRERLKILFCFQSQPSLDVDLLALMAIVTLHIHLLWARDQLFHNDVKKIFHHDADLMSMNFSGQAFPDTSLLEE